MVSAKKLQIEYHILYKIRTYADEKTALGKIEKFQLFKHRAYEAIRQRVIHLTLRYNEQLVIEALEQRDKILADARISDQIKNVLEDFVPSNEFKFFCRR